MDIQTKFSVGDICLFLMAEEDDSTDIRIVEAEVKKIKIISSEHGMELTYVVMDEHRNKLELKEDILCVNHNELIQHLFDSENVRTFLNKNHIRKKEEPKDIDSDYGFFDIDVPGMGGIDGRLNADDIFRQILSHRNT